MDGALPLSYCTSPYTSPTLPDGTHTFYVTAVDGSGNQDPIPAYQTFTVDTQPPETTIGSGPLGNTISRTASFAFAASEPGPGFSCSLDGAAFAACVSPASYAGLKLGAHTFSVRATDAAGNVDASPAARAWTVVAPCVVPNVRGKTLSSARRSITAAHCAVGKVTKAYSTKVKSGLVISQSPAAKKTLSPGAKVNLVVSRGRRRR